MPPKTRLDQALDAAAGAVIRLPGLLGAASVCVAIAELVHRPAAGLLLAGVFGLLLDRRL